MGHDEHPDLAALAASAVDWWRDAGVDVLVDDLPRNWLAAPPLPSPSSGARQAPAPLAAPPPAELPRDLDAFLAWRMGSAPPDAAWPGRRVAPAIAPGAAIVVLTGVPEAEDVAAGKLHAGSTGRLLDRILAAIGQDRGSVSLISVATGRPLGGQIPIEAEPDLAEITLHFLKLLRPRTVLSFGQAANRALFGADGERAGGRLHSINLEGGHSADVLALLALRSLLDRPATKANVWNDLLLHIGGKGE